MKILCSPCILSGLSASASQSMSGTVADQAAAGQVVQLERVARVGSVMVDGDVCRRIVNERALRYMFTVDQRNFVDVDRRPSGQDPRRDSEYARDE